MSDKSDTSNKRKKNIQWTLPTNSDGTTSWDGVKVAVLMDIRDELQHLNALLGCKNFTRIPLALAQIEENTTPKKPPEKKPIKKKR